MECIKCNIPLSGNQKKFCSNKCKQKGHYDKISQNNSYHAQTIRSYERKIKLIEISGGGCNECGYNKNIAALEFHHIDPTTKSFSLDARRLSNTRWEYILIEHSKCILLCGNCHSEHHYPEMELNNVKQILKTYKVT